MASENDFFQKKGAGTVTTLASPGKALGATSITVGSTANYPTETGITIGIRQVDTAGDLISGTYTEWTGVVASGTSITINATPVYGSDQVYPAGSTTQVYIPLSETSHNRLVDGILTHANQDGLLLGTPESFVGTAGDIGGAWKSGTVTLTSSGTIPTYSTNIVKSTLIGKTAIVSIELVNSGGGTAGSGANLLNIALPYTPKNSGRVGAGSIYNGGTTIIGAQVICNFVVVVSAGSILAYLSIDDQNVQAANQSNANRYIYLTCTYEVA